MDPPKEGKPRVARVAFDQIQMFTEIFPETGKSSRALLVFAAIAAVIAIAAFVALRLK